MQPPRVSPAVASWDDCSAHLCPCRQNFPWASTFSGKSTINPNLQLHWEWWTALVALVVLQVIQLPRREGLRKLPWVPGKLRCVLHHEQAVIRVCCWNATDWGPCCSAECNISNTHSQQRLLWAWDKTETFLKLKKKDKKKETPSNLAFIRHKTCFVFY